MKKAYLIYKPAEALKNQGFIRLFQEAGREFDIDFSYVSDTEYQKKELPSLVLNRTREEVVSRWYEKKGVRVLHSAKITEIGNNKWKTLLFLQEKLSKVFIGQKWVPETVFLSGKELDNWLELSERKNFSSLTGSDCFLNGVSQEAGAFLETERDFVVKSVSGHGGSEVLAFSTKKLFMPSEEEKEERLLFLENLGKLRGRDCIIQEMISSDSKDVRVYILGNRIYQGILRQGETDFRSNFSLGGKTECYSFSKEEECFIETVLAAFEEETLGLAGLDFIITREGRLIFNELEEMAGCRMLYQNTTKNIVRDYVKWIVQNSE